MVVTTELVEVLVIVVVDCWTVVVVVVVKVCPGMVFVTTVEVV